MVFSPDTRL